MIAEGHVRADRPDPEREPLLAALVNRYQIHRCMVNKCGGPGSNEKCKEGFPKDICERTYHRPGNNRYTYKRTENDIWVVEYNAELLLIWEGHLNVQYVTNAGLLAYMVKYVTKAEPHSVFSTGKEESRVDQHLLARRMGSMEVMVMALGFDIFRCSTSSVFLPTAVPSMRNSTVRPPREIERDPDNPYYPDALDKYFARPVCYEDLTYFKYFQQCQVSKRRIMHKDGPRPGVQDAKGYWIYLRGKPKLIRTAYRRLCDGEAFFFIHLLHHWTWRSDEEILGGMPTYRQRLFDLNPLLFHRLLTGHDEREETARRVLGQQYFEMTQRVSELTPVNVQDLVRRQLEQLNSMTIPGANDAAAIALEGDQYEAYTTVTQDIRAGGRHGKCFFITGSAGTGKSYLLKALEHWCNTSKNHCIVLAPTGIAARNISGRTVHSALSIYKEGGSYKTGFFRFDEATQAELLSLKVIILDEISMVDAELLNYLSSLFRRLKKNSLPFGGLHIIAYGDILQLPPVDGHKVWYSTVWPLFHPVFLRQPRRQADRRFYEVLNKIRFGIVDEEVRELLIERHQAYNPTESMWMSTHLCSLRNEAKLLNDLILGAIPETKPAAVYNAEDFQNDEPIDSPSTSTIFKHNTNFPSTITCKIGGKVMFLTNGMLHTKGIANGSLGVITDILENGDIEAAFPTKNGIEVSLKIKNLFTHTKDITVTACAVISILQRTPAL